MRRLDGRDDDAYGVREYEDVSLFVVFRLLFSFAYVVHTFMLQYISTS